jgi:hypothetical protein
MFILHIIYQLITSVHNAKCTAMHTGIRYKIILTNTDLDYINPVHISYHYYSRYKYPLHSSAIAWSMLVSFFDSLSKYTVIRISLVLIRKT